MAYFSIPYRILFHDTMAYGSQHHMTNIKLQNIARESLLFLSKFQGQGYEEQLSNVVMLTREAYSLNLLPVDLGKIVYVLMTYENPTRSTVRLCFRIINEQNQAVACGYQTMVLMDARTQELIPAPAILAQYLDVQNKYNIIEHLQTPSFKEILSNDKLSHKLLFDAGIEKVGRFLLRNLDHANALIVNEHLEAFDIAQINNAKPVFKRVFVLPGQGSFDPQKLDKIYHEMPGAKTYFDLAQKLATEILNKDFYSYLKSLKSDNYIANENEFRDGDQAGIYLTNVLTGKYLIDQGLKPDLLLGHSFGEIAAFALAGFYTIEEGLYIVFQRIKALNNYSEPGIMASVAIDGDELKGILRSSPFSDIHITVKNHPKQTVISGTQQDIEELQIYLAKQGISLTKIKSNYAFHSNKLRNAVQPFADAISKINYTTPNIPVVIGSTGQLASANENIPVLFSKQFVTPFDFIKIVHEFVSDHAKQVMDCGGKPILSSILKKNTDRPLSYFHLELESSFEAQLRSIDGTNNAIFDNKLNDSSESKKNIDSIPIISKQEIECIEQHEPIAIVSMGCVLPGSDNPESFWQNAIQGNNCISNLAETDPDAKQDFVAGSHADNVIVPDKTYALLSGSIKIINYETYLKPFISEAEFMQFTRAQKILALSIGQCLHSPSIDMNKGRYEIYLGSTADGSEEFDERGFLQQLKTIIPKHIEDESQQKELLDLIKSQFQTNNLEQAAFPQHESLKTVVDYFFKNNESTYVMDTACSSSLYSINFGIKSLRENQSDIVFAGGVFAPGPANNTLFAQFRGLTPDQSRPFDHKANGVVFSDGGGIVVLKRLKDAITDKDNILGVIREMGLSSDGKSPSINVPQSRGQVIAMSEAYRRSGIDPTTIDYVEAHATSTPVGDAVELNAIKEVFKPKMEGQSPYILGSVKALIGHTGWVSGVASIIKICQAFKYGILPGQHNFEKLNENVELHQNDFLIPAHNLTWEKRNNQPLRAGINAFGFGGTNSHCILESWEPEYHQALTKYQKVKTEKKPQKVAVISQTFLYPGIQEFTKGTRTGTLQFDRSKAHLPVRKLLLPDITEDMDISQFLSGLICEKLLKDLPDFKKGLNKRTGSLIGLCSKTERGIKANQRIFRHKFKRLVSAATQNPTTRDNLNLLVKAIEEQIKVSGPYTLPGLMPNLASGRMANMYNLNGANIVIDGGKKVVEHTIQFAEKILTHKDCDAVICGSMAVNGLLNEEEEAAFGLLLMLPEKAHELGIPVVKEIEVRDLIQEISMPANQEFSIADKISKIGSALNGTVEEIKNTNGSTSSTQVEIGNNGISKEENQTAAFKFLTSSTIQHFHPILIKENFTNKTTTQQKNKSFLIISEDNSYVDEYVLPLVSRNHVATVLNQNLLDEFYEKKNNGEILPSFDYIVVLKMQREDKRAKSFDNNWFSTTLLCSLFDVSKIFYEPLSENKTKLVCCFGNSLKHKTIDPFIGQFSGFLKSLSRELNREDMFTLCSDTKEVEELLQQLDQELQNNFFDKEVTYIENDRWVSKLMEEEVNLELPKFEFKKPEVVIATGGGKGVTAVLCEELLTRYQCKVIALGRTSLNDVPEFVLQKSEEEFAAYETTYYKEQLVSSGKKIIELKKEFHYLKGVNELHNVILRLKKLPGSFEYICVDLTNEAKVHESVNSVIERFGKIDFVMHGAGVQLSYMLTKKKKEDFLRVISTKLDGLLYLHRSISSLQNSHTVRWHLLTSAFSYLGNDGQEDYGAANETLNRIAERMSAIEGQGTWTSMAWLGWAGIGMTSGSEYAALATRRKLRGVTREEGKRFFRSILENNKASNINIILAEGEIDFYKPSLHKSTPLNPDFMKLIYDHEGKRTYEFTPNVSDIPYLEHHVVDGHQTVPGALLLMIAGKIASEFRPNLFIHSFEDTLFQKFVMIKENKENEFRITAQILEESKETTLISIRFLSDFIHSSGTVLQKDVLYSEIRVRMGNNVQEFTGGPIPQLDNPDSPSIQDPYIAGEERLSLSGPFDTLSQIQIGEKYRSASFFKSPDNFKAPLGLKDKMIFVDAFWRFGTIMDPTQPDSGLFVPTSCKYMKVFFDFNTKDWNFLNDKSSMNGCNPIAAEDILKVGPIYAQNQKGTVMLEVNYGTCYRINTAPTKIKFEIDQNA